MRFWDIILSTLTFVFVMVGGRYAWGFVLSYRRENWREYDAGRHLMEFTFGLAVVLSYTALALPLRFVLDHHPWFSGVIDFIRLLIFIWLAKVLHHRHHLLIENRRGGVSSQTNQREGSS